MFVINPATRKMATVLLVLLIFSIGSAADQAQLTIAEYNIMGVLRNERSNLSFLTEIS
jgi:3-isopropylmalate dehydratase small subunit